MALAIIAVVLYLLELRGLVSPSGPARAASISLDMLFILDVSLKLIVRRGRYLRSAWLMTDILSCLPGILLMANAPWLQALQFTRLFRVLRVLRGLRVLRSLQFMPSLARVAAEQDEDGRHFRIGMNVAVSVYAVVFIGVLSWLRAEFGSETRLLDDAEFFLVVGALLATVLFLYLIHSQLREDFLEPTAHAFEYRSPSPSRRTFLASSRGIQREASGPGNGPLYRLRRFLGDL